MQLNNTKLYTLLFCCITASLSLFAKDHKLSKDETKQLGIKKPLVFVENKGQIINQHYKKRSDIQYEVYGNGVNVFVGKGQLHYQFNKLNFTKVKHPAAFEPKQKISSVNSYRLDVSLVGANANAKVVTEGKEEYHESYRLGYLGKDKITAGSYGKITYKDIYPHIDWVLYTKNGKLEYDFVVNPGGNVKDIKLKYTGATKIALENGAIALESPLGNVKEEKPYAYNQQSGDAIASNFVVNNNVVGFNTGAYTGTLVIDPQISWATYFGGNGADESNNALADKSGNIYSVGQTSSISSVATTGTHQTSYGGATYDCFLSKYNSSGTLVWATYFGGSGTETAQDVAYDGTNLYITGYTSTVTGGGMATKGAYDTTYHGGTTGFGTGDAFLAKFSTDDTLIWSTYYGGTGSDAGYGVACDASGNVYMCGVTNSATVMASSNGYDTSYAGNGDMFLAKFSSSGSRIWATYYGGTGSFGAGADAAYDVAVDKAGNPYMIGNSSSTGLATSGAFQTTYTTSAFLNQSGLLIKFNSSGNLVWATYYGNGGTFGYSLAFDTLNKLYIAGYTGSSTSIASANAYQTTFGGGTGGMGSFPTDIFLAKFDTSGQRLWGTYYGGTGNDFNYSGITFDAWNNVLFTGHTASNNAIAIVGIDSFNVAQKNYMGGRDINITKFTPLGQLLWGTYYGGQRDDEGRGIVYLGSNDGIYVSGFTTSPDSFATVNGYDTVYGTSGTGPSDAFLLKLNPDTFVVVNQTYTDTLLCPGSTWNVNYTASHAFNSGNTFSVVLSSPAGDFTAPTTIGSINATTSGSISCTIPLASLGIGYRIRIVSSSPVFISPDDYYNIHVTNTVPTSPTITSNSPTCIGDSIKLTANTAAPTPVTYSWFGPGGYIASTNNITRTPATVAMAGTYKIVTSHSGCPADSTTTNVVVNSTFPSAPVDSTNAPVCTGTDLKLYTRTSTGGVTYTWTGPSGFSSTLQNPVIPAAAPTATGVYYNTVNLNGCKDKDSIYAEVDVPSKPNITITANCYRNNITKGRIRRRALCIAVHQASYFIIYTQCAAAITAVSC